MSDPAPATHDGGCLCGRVRFVFSGPILLTSACHCRGCQQLTGSAFSLSIGTPLSQFKVIRGEVVIGALHGETPYLFCDWCKCWIYTSLEAMGDFVNVRTTLLDTPLTAPPFVETFTCEALPWVNTGARHSYPRFPVPADYERLTQEYIAAAQD
jgi:hypothetical protein